MQRDMFSKIVDGTQVDSKIKQSFKKSFFQVQDILDQNRVLINQINHNLASKIPENLKRNVGLIRELNNNIKRVTELYDGLSISFANSKEASWIRNIWLHREAAIRDFYFSNIFDWSSENIVADYLVCGYNRDRNGSLRLWHKLASSLQISLLVLISQRAMSGQALYEQAISIIGLTLSVFNEDNLIPSALDLVMVCNIIWIF